MAECKIPVRIDGYKCVEDMVQDVLNYTYKGKTLKEWADSISKPQTNADRIRGMTDEEMAEWIAGDVLNLTGGALAMATEAWLDWLKQEANK